MVTCAGAVSAAGTSGLIAKKFQEFYDYQEALLGQPELGRAELLSRNYDQLFSSIQNSPELRMQSSQDVDLLFRAAYDALFYTFDKKYIDYMLADLRLLDDRHHSIARYHIDLYRSFIRVREFGGARKFASEHQVTHDNLPIILHKDGRDHNPSELVLSSDERVLTRRNIELSPGPQIVVIGHPLCHFSQNATKFIEESPELYNVFLKHSRWIMPQDGVLSTNVVARWNKHHPAFFMTYIYRQSDWPVIDAWGTPSFYFFADGRLVGKLTGWPPAGGVSELRKELRKIGLIR